LAISDFVSSAGAIVGVYREDLYRTNYNWPKGTDIYTRPTSVSEKFR